MPLDPIGYGSFRSINKRLDPSKIGQDEVEDALNATFRDLTLRKRKGFKKKHLTTATKAAASFDGTNFGWFPSIAILRTVLNTPGTEWTFECKIRTGPSLSSTNQEIYAKRADSATYTLRLFIRGSDHVLRFDSRDVANGASIAITGTTVLQPNTLYHIAIIKNDTADELQLWLAEEGGSFADDGSAAINSPSPTAIKMDDDAFVYFGALPDSGNVDNDISELFTGELSEVRLWSKALSASELAAYQSIGIPRYLWGEDLEFYIPFNEGQQALFEEKISERDGIMTASVPQWSEREALTGTHSLHFNRYTSYVQMPDSVFWADLEAGSGSAYFTIALRVKIPRLGDGAFSGSPDYALFQRPATGGTGTAPIYLHIDSSSGNDTITLEVKLASVSSVTVTSSDSLSRDTEYLILATFDGSGDYSGNANMQGKFKLNDNAVVTDTTAQAVSTNGLLAGANAFIGAEHDTFLASDFRSGFPGIIDQYAIWHEWLDLDDLYDEITANGGIIDPEGVIGGRAKIIYHFDLDRSSFTTLFDRSGNGQDATLKTLGVNMFDNGAINDNEWGEGAVSPTESPRVHGIYDFEKSGDTQGNVDASGQHIIAHIHSSIFELVDESLVLKRAGVAFSDTSPTLFQPMHGYLIISNQADFPYDFDGIDVNILTPETPSVAPGLSASGSGSSLVNAAYRFRITFLNKRAGKRSISSSGASVTPSAGQNIVVDYSAAVAALQDDQVTHVEIWMTLDNESTGLFFFQGEYEIDNVNTQTVSADPETSVEVLDTTVIRMPRLSAIAVHRSRLFGAKTTDPREIVYSPVNRPEFVEGSFFVEEPCTALQVQNGQLCVFTLTKKYILSGNTPLAYNLNPFNVSTSSVGQGSIAAHEDVLYYPTKKGPYIDTYNNQTYLGGNIQKDVDLWNDSQSRLWVSTYAPNLHQVLMAVTFGESQSTNNRLYVFNLPRGPEEQGSGWEAHSLELTALAAVRDPDTGDLVVYAGWQGFLVELFTLHNDGAGTASDLKGALTGGNLTSAQNSAAAWPTSGDGLRGVVFENLSTGASGRILSNETTSLTFDGDFASGSPNAAGNSYRMAGIPLSIRSREEDFGSPHQFTYVAELYLVLEEEANASGDAVAISALIDGATVVTDLSVTPSSTRRRQRLSVARAGQDWQMIFDQPDPNSPVEILECYYRVRPQSRRL